MKKNFVVFFCFLFFSCGKSVSRPAGVLPETKMDSMMWDMLRADQYVVNYVMKDSTKNKKDESTKLYDQIFRLYHVNKNEFSTSLKYYQSEPQLIKPILDSLAEKQKQIMDKQLRKSDFMKDTSLKIAPGIQ